MCCQKWNKANSCGQHFIGEVAYKIKAKRKHTMLVPTRTHLLTHALSLCLTISGGYSWFKAKAVRW